MAKRISHPTAKKQVAATKKLVAAASREQKRDLAEKWRVLRRIGAYNTRETAAMNRLTKSRIREINRRFKEVQKMKVMSDGKTVRPLAYVQKTTKSGRKKLVLEFTPNFTFVKTKNKTPRTVGLQKTKKGYIIQKPPSVKKVTISRKGEIKEHMGGRITRRKRWRGDDILLLIREIEKGSFPFKRNDLMMFHRWGSPISHVDFDESLALEFAKYIQHTRSSMDERTFQSFLSKSYVEFVTYREG